MCDYVHMNLPRKFLGTDEHVILHLRTHGKALIMPYAGLLVAVAAAVALYIYVPASWGGAATWTIVGLSLIAIVAFFVLPFLRWRTSTYSITNRRVITRKGIINKSGHDLPLSRINNITYERSLMDRILGCGTLVFTTAAEAPVTLPDVPKVEQVHVLLTELLFGDDDRYDSSRAAPHYND